MESLMKFIGGAVLVIATVFVAATLSGTVLWGIYPHIHALFPTAAKNGIIAVDLGWWDSVCICWIFGILVKGGSSSSSSKKD
jgi:hypothetical protein